MNIADATIVNLYEVQCCPLEDIQQSLELPLAYVLDVLERKSPKYKTLLALRERGGADVVAESSSSAIAETTDEDIPDAKFARIREEAFALALSSDSHPFIRANMIKFLWNKKRPDNEKPITINVKSINLALAKAKEIRSEKLAKSNESISI